MGETQPQCSPGQLGSWCTDEYGNKMGTGKEACLVASRVNRGRGSRPKPQPKKKKQKEVKAEDVLEASVVEVVELVALDVVLPARVRARRRE